ncbi:MAG: protein ImuA [Arenicella sp.]|jgi:protein ImuA
MLPPKTKKISPPENKHKQIDQLIEQHSNSIAGKLWRGKDQRNNKGQKIVSSGYPKLDKQLHLNGWPLASTVELGLSQAGIGELRLLAPALRELQNNHHQNIIWVAPPFLPYAPALIKEQIDISRLTIVQTNNIQDSLWAAEQALLSECCSAVLLWTGNYNLSIRELRRLHLAAQKSKTWNVLFRHSDCLKQASAASLRLHLQANSFSQLNVHIVKQPQGWAGQSCTLSLQPHYENWQRLSASLLPQANRIQTPMLREHLSDNNSVDHHQASVTVLSSLSALQVAH